MLKANGLTRRELVKLPVCENLRNVAVIFGLSLLAALGCIQVVNLLFNQVVLTLSWTAAAALLVVSMACILLPVVISGVVLSRIQPDRVLRG